MIKTLPYKKILQKYASSGLFAHLFPSKHGGSNCGYSSMIADYIKIGYQCFDCGLILSMHAHLWGALYAIYRYGNNTQKQHYLKNLITAKIIGGHAITEPQAGSDISLIETIAKETENGFSLNGRKRYITNIPEADIMIVYAKHGNKISGFIIHCDDKGISFENGPTITGCQTAPMGDIIMTDAYIPKNRMLGHLGLGANMIQHVLENERAFLFAGIVGIMQRQLEVTIDFLKNRTISSGALSNQQSIYHRLAELKLKIDTAKLWVEKCAMLRDNNQRITLESAQTKLFASEAYQQISLATSHFLGAYGLEKKNRLTDHVLSAMASCLFSGSSELQKNIIAAMIGAY